MKLSTVVLCAAPVALVMATTATSSKNGIYSTSIVRMSGCAGCHRRAPGSPTGFPAIVVDVSPAQRSLSTGQQISMTLTAKGGQTASNMGGFSAEVTRGSFSAASGTRTWSGGIGISHNSPGPRTWKFGYTAPGTGGEGLVEMYTAVNTVNNNGQRDSNDFWGFHEFDTTNGISTPVRMFANAAGVRSIGAGCEGSFRNWPVFGARISPNIGSGFALELHGAAPNSPAVVLLGTTPNFNLDLSSLGISGCTLWVQRLLDIPGRTGGGNAQRGEGSATFPLPIPNNPFLRGLKLQLQPVFVDVNNSRPIKVTLANAVEVTIR